VQGTIEVFISRLHSDEAREKTKTFVYDILKTFSREAKEKFKKTKLQDLLNDITVARRGEVFEDEENK